LQGRAPHGASTKVVVSQGGRGSGQVEKYNPPCDKKATNRSEKKKDPPSGVEHTRQEEKKFSEYQ